MDAWRGTAPNAGVRLLSIGIRPDLNQANPLSRAVSRISSDQRISGIEIDPVGCVRVSRGACDVRACVPVVFGRHERGFDLCEILLSDEPQTGGDERFHGRRADSDDIGRCGDQRLDSNRIHILRESKECGLLHRKRRPGRRNRILEFGAFLMRKRQLQPFRGHGRQFTRNADIA